VVICRCVLWNGSRSGSYHFPKVVGNYAELRVQVHFLWRAIH
jgi:hypothetical protein